MAHLHVVDYLLAHRESDRVALIAGEEQLTHRELARAVDATASSLIRIGVLPGKLVGIVADNGPTWVRWYLAVLRVGAVALPIPGRESARLQAAAVRLPGVSHVLCQGKYVDALQKAVADTPVGLYADVRREGGPPSLPASPPISRWPQGKGGDDLAAVMLTSGSTGDPKGVAVSHGNIVANTRSILSVLHLQADDRIMVVLPLHYCFGLSLLHTHLRAGGSVVFENRFIFPDVILQQIEEKQCTGFAGVPSTYQMLLRKSSITKKPPAALRYVQQAGGRLPPAVLAELRQVLSPHTRVFVMYGATEATARMSYLPPACLDEKMGSIGVPIPGVRFEVVNEAGQACALGEVGELVATGENITHGYFNDATLSAQRFAGRRFFTGDLARQDEDGFFYIEGRASDFIKSFGFRVSPREVRDVLCSHPQVVDAAVVGEPDVEAGEALVAYVVLASEGTSADQLLAFCAQQLPNHKLPREIRLVSELPRNEAGKVLTRLLRTSSGEGP